MQDDHGQPPGAKGSFFILYITALYFLLALVYTYPLSLRLNTHIPATGGDMYTYLWSLWWVKHALLELHTSPFYTDYIFFPHRVSLAQHALVFINGLLYAPLSGFISVVTANNIFVIMSYVLSGLGTYFLLHRLTGHKLASLVGSLVFAFSPYRNTALDNGHINYVMTQWLPWYFWALISMDRAERRWNRYAIMAGVFLALNFYTEYYFFIFCLLVTAMYFFIHVRRPGRLLRLLRRSAALVLVALVLMSPILIHMMTGEKGPARASQPAYAGGFPEYAADFMGFFVPPGKYILGNDQLWKQIRSYGITPTYMGLSVIALLAMAVVKGRKAETFWFWCIVLVLFSLLSLGPRLRVYGTLYQLPLPYVLMVKLPVLEHMRVPGRFHIMTMLAASVIVAFGLSSFRMQNRLITCIVAVLILAEFIAVPITTTRAGIPEPYRAIAEGDTGQSVLETPFFIRDGYDLLGINAEQQLYYQTAHGRKLFNGFVSRLDDRDIFYSYLNLPLIRHMVLVEYGLFPGSEQISAERRLAQEVIELFGIEHVVMHKNTGMDMLHSYLRSMISMQKIAEDDKIVVYKTLRKESHTGKIDLGTESSIAYLKRGWINGQREAGRSFAWLAGGEAEVLANLQAGEAYRVSFTARPPSETRGQELTFDFNGRYQGRVSIAPGWKNYYLDIPPSAVLDGLNRIHISAGHTAKRDLPLVVRWTRSDVSGMFLRQRLNTYKIKPADWEQDNRVYANDDVSLAVESIGFEKTSLD